MDWTLFGIFLLACMGAASTGAAFSPGPWYDNLKKPSWTPPNWLFPLAWTVLYLMMAYSAALIAMHENNAYGMAFWALQISFNTLWTPVFFGLKKLREGLYVIAVLWLAVLGVTITFWQLDQWAGLMNIPYLIWVSYAAALNFSIWRMNPKPSL